MPADSATIYLEPDDEITSVVRRVRAADARRIILVAAGRTKATSSVVALRLLAALAADESLTVALVADPMARSLAAEAGIPAYASVAEATAGTDVAVAPGAHRAAIRVVRPETAPAVAPDSGLDPSSEETRAVPVVRSPAPARARPPAPRARPAPARRVESAGRRRGSASRFAMLALGLLLLFAAGAAAALLPGATVVVDPVTKSVGPVAYVIDSVAVQHVTGDLSQTVSGKATGDHVERATASGSVVFQSGNPGRCRVAKGTIVSAGDVTFATVETIVVPEGKFTGRGVQPGAAAVGIGAVDPGPAGNVAAGAIDTIRDAQIRFCLTGFVGTVSRLVNNPKPTTGGAENHQPEILQADVDAAVSQLRATLLDALTTTLKARSADLLVVPSPKPEQPSITVPDGLVGKRGDASFKLSGTLSFDRAAVPRADVLAAARDRLLSDTGRLPAGTTWLTDSVRVDLGAVAGGGNGVSVPANVTASAAPELDVAAIRRRIVGLTAAEAEAALADIGHVRVDLWPGWVERVPSMSWRVDVELHQAGADASAVPSAS